MTDKPDLLQQVSRALRERHDGRNAGSGFTRARVLNSLKKDRKRRSAWWKAGIPAGILLIGTSAWAQATGHWPAVWSTVASVFSLPLTDEGKSEALSVTANAVQLSSPRPEPDAEPQLAPLHEATPIEQPIIAELDPVQLSSSLPPPLAPVVPPVVASETRAIRPPSVKPAPPVTASELEPDPDVIAFRTANDLDVKAAGPDVALAAYQGYLNRFPSGRFVPEAHYNSAVLLLRLGRHAEARRRLTPFAAGRYGSYRQSQAQQLLRALDELSNDESH